MSRSLGEQVVREFANAWAAPAGQAGSDGAIAHAKKMILTLQDDGVLRVYKSVDDVADDVEALDAEETFQGRLLRFIVANGEYTLVPQNKKDVPALLRLLQVTKSVEPPEAAAQLKELERRLFLTDTNGHSQLFPSYPRRCDLELVNV